MALRVAIGAGHCDSTPGKRVPLAMGYGHISEWSLNARIVEYIVKDLRTYKDVEILRLDDPTGKVDVPLKERTTLANNWKADVYISVHHNVNKGVPWDGGGITVYAHPNASATSKRLQKILYDALIKETGLVGNRYTGVPTANFHVLRESKMPAVLSENGFMDSKQDIKVITTDKFAKQAAKAHVNALVTEYGIKKKLLPIPNPEKPVDKTLYRVQVGAYSKKENAYAMEQKLKADKFDTYLIQGPDKLYRVQTGAFAIRDNALALEKNLKSVGYETFITTNAANSVAPDEPKPTERKPKVGDRVKVKANAKSYNGVKLASFVYKNTYRIDYLTGDRAVLDSKGINTPIHVKDLILQ